VAKRFLPLIVLAAAVALNSQRVPAQTSPRLADYFTPIPRNVLDAGYTPAGIFHAIGDVNGDRYDDLIVLGAWYPGGGVTCCTPQPGRVYLSDGDGHFSPAPADLFPVDTLLTVHPRKVLFADFNADGRPDMFISSHGWDADPFPGEQNRLYLSRPDGGWRDATANLPEISDFSHSSAAGDVSGRGVIDIFVGNGYGRISPYFLLNTGSGQFTPTRTNIPAGTNQFLAITAFPSSTLTDLNGDGLPELVVGCEGRGTTILWNRAGVFVETDRTELPPTAAFRTTHTDYDVQRIDVNQDGLPDLVIVGTQRRFFRGWFVQVLINKGNRQFVDETATRVPPGEASAGIEESSGASASAPDTTPSALWVRVLDFNQDGAPDFAVEFNATGSPFTQDQPVVWLNDGAGHFSTLKARDFVAAGNESSVLGGPHLIATRNGYSFIGPQLFGNNLGLWIQGGLLATRPYRLDGIPGQPTVTNATATEGTLQIMWTSGTGLPPTAHRLEFFAGSAAVASLNVAAATTVSIPIPAGTAGSFSVRVTALTGATAGPPSSLFAFTIGSSPGGSGCTSAPASPVVTGAIVAGTATVSWPAVPGATSYIVSAGSTQGASNVAPPTNVGPNTTVSPGGLPPGFSAWVRVIAVNACGQSPPRDFFLSSGSTP
jgi:hypothetical protein